MVLAIYAYLLVLLMIIFCSYKKKLHLFEIFFIWMTVWIITHSTSSILTTNLQVLEIPKDPFKFSMHFLNRTILYPLIIIIFFDIYVRLQSHFLKIMLLFISILTLTISESIFIHLRIMVSRNYYLYDVLTEWIITLLITLFAWIWYRKKLLLR